MANQLQNVEVGEEFKPVPQEQLDAAIQGIQNGEAPITPQPQKPDRNPQVFNQEPVKEERNEPAPDSSAEEPLKPEESTESSEAEKAKLPLDKEGNVEFSEEMVDEIKQKAKEANPKANEEDLSKIIDEQKQLINELHADSSTSETVVSPDEQPQISPEVINSSIKERTEGQYETIDDLLQAQKDLKEKVDFDFIHPAVKRLNEVLTQGGQMDDPDILNFLRVQTTDYDNMDLFDLVGEVYRMEEPGISEHEIYENLDKFHVILNKSQEEIDEMIENEEITESRVNALISEFERMGNNAYGKLKDMQEGMSTSFLPTEEEIQQHQEKANAENQKIIDSFNQQVEENISTFTNHKIKVGNDKDQNPVYFDYKVSDARKKEIEAAAKNINQFIADRFIDKKTGAVDFPKMFSDINMLLDRESILASAVARTANQQRKETVSLFNNYSFLDQGQSGKRSEPKRSVSDQLSDQLMQFHAQPGFSNRR